MAGVRSRRAFTFVEILVASAVMAVVFVPIASLIRDHFRKVSDDRMEAAAAGVAAEVMNEWLFKRDYNDVQTTSSGSREDEDGISYRWTMHVYPVGPNNGNDMTFEYVRIPYHNPVARGCHAAGGAEKFYNEVPDGDPDFTNNIKTPTAAEIDTKYATGPPPIVTLHLVFEWKHRWEDWPATPNPLRTRHLITRRANIE